MSTLRYRFNYRQDALPAQPTRHMMVGVHTRSGDTERVRWLGMLELENAKQLAGARPVRLDVNAFTLEDGAWVTGWQPIPSNRFVQGALVPQGVYGVAIEGSPRFVGLPENGQDTECPATALCCPL